MTAMCLDRAMDDGESETASTVLGRGEWLEEPVTHVLGDSRPVIPDPDRDPAGLEEDANGETVGRDTRHVDGDRARGPDRLHRIQGQVEDRPVEEVLVRLHEDRFLLC